MKTTVYFSVLFFMLIGFYKLLSSQLPENYKFRLPAEAQGEYVACGKKSKDYKFMWHCKKYTFG